MAAVVVAAGGARGARGGGPAGRVLLAAAGVAAAGVAVSLALPGSLLIVQLQPWRALWLVSFLPPAGFAPMAGGLWRRRGAARGGPAPVTAAWLAPGAGGAAPPPSAPAGGALAPPAAAGVSP